MERTVFTILSTGVSILIPEFRVLSLRSCCRLVLTKAPLLVIAIIMATWGHSLRADQLRDS